MTNIKPKIKNYQVTATIVVTTEANDEDEALKIGLECLDWSNAYTEVEEIEDE